MNNLVFGLGFLLISALAAQSDKTQLVQKLDTIKPAQGWEKAIAIEPNVLMLVAKDSYVAVQAHASATPLVRDLKSQLDSGEIKPSHKFGDWTVKSITKAGLCTEMSLANSASRTVNQTWCFGPASSFAINESGSARLPEGERSKIMALVKQEVAQ